MAVTCEVTSDKPENIGFEKSKRIYNFRGYLFLLLF